VNAQGFAEGKVWLGATTVTTNSLGGASADPLVTLPSGGGVISATATTVVGRTYGATTEECHRELPGDEGCTNPQIVTTHATTMNVPPDAVWPWLVQMGWGRAQWYTSRWVDRLFFPDNGPSADRIAISPSRVAVLA